MNKYRVIINYLNNKNQRKVFIKKYFLPKKSIDTLHKLYDIKSDITHITYEKPNVILDIEIVPLEEVYEKTVNY